MTPDQRSYNHMSRLSHYFDIMRTVTFGFAGLAAIIELGPEGYSAPLTMVVIATAAFGILAGNTTLDDVASLRDDMDEDEAATNYGKSLKSRNYGALKMASTVLIGLVAVSELYAIFT